MLPLRGPGKNKLSEVQVSKNKNVSFHRYTFLMAWSGLEMNQGWISDGDEVYVKVEILGQEHVFGLKERLCKCKKSNGQVVSVPIQLVLPVVLNPSQFSDLVDVEPLNEATLLDAIKTRARNGMFYSWCSNTLIAVNPFKSLEIYGPETMLAYADKEGKLDPHIFGIAKRALDCLSRGESQSIIINGESGSGKTESAKYLIKFFTFKEKHSENLIAEKIYRSNPILEAFGNAKTSRNNNSSRFGKLIDIQFDDSTKISGAFIETYLLEKSRVVKLDEKERNYHIFYQMLAGLEAHQKMELGLDQAASEFSYLNQSFHDTNQSQVLDCEKRSTRKSTPKSIYSNCFTADGIDDAALFQDTLKGMAAIGLNEGEIDAVFKMLASILLLGNVQISGCSRDDTAQLVLEDKLRSVSHVLEVDHEMLKQCLLYEIKEIRKEKTFSPNTCKKATEMRDTIAKSIYDYLFKWLVFKINCSLESKNGKRSNSIRILDIFGFESFERNGLEQLCINYANESLHQLFITDIFKAVQQEYASEGIEWDPITFTDNKHVVDIVGGKAGIFDLMSDSLSLGFSASGRQSSNYFADYRSATDRFVNCLRAKTIKDGPLQATLRLKNQFIVNHFAGQVVYTADGMLEKNTDPMPTLLFETLSSSRSEYIRQIVDYQTKDSSSKSGRKDHSKTITRQFRSQVEMLCESLKQSHIHYVKCIKPTDSKKPGDFEAAKTCEQIRCSGVLNAIEISRKSFPISREFSQFLKEFHTLVTATVKSKYPRSEQLQILKIVQEALTEKVTFHIGKTKVFMKSSDYEALKKLCLYEMGKQATVIQSRWRMMNKVRHFRLARKAVLFAQKSWRMMIQRKSYCVIKSAVQMVQIWWRYVCKRSVWRRKRKANAASKILRWYMLCKDRSRYRQTKRAIVILQKAFRAKKLVQAAKEKQQKENLVQQNEKLRSDLLTMDQKNKMLQDQNTELQIQLEEMKLKIAAYEADLQERRESARYEGAQDLHYSCLTPISDADNDDDLSSEEVLEGSFACDVINNEETNVDDTLHGDVHKIKEEIVIQHTSCHQQDQEIQCFIEDDDGDGEGVYCKASVERVLPPDLTTFERLMMKAKEAGYDSSEEISSDSLGSSTRAVISNLFGLLHQVAVLKAELGLQ